MKDRIAKMKAWIKEHDKQLGLAAAGTALAAVVVIIRREAALNELTRNRAARESYAGEAEQFDELRELEARMALEEAEMDSTK